MASGAWYYHAPSKRQVQEQVHAPPPSQIPGLSQGLDAPEDSAFRRGMIKDTDSPYIIMAKQGGRPDLLRYRSPKPRSEGPQGYPRCEWYYQQDVLASEETEDKGCHEFMLPDYMVHQEWPGRETKQGSGSRRRVPFAQDEKSVFSREDTNPTDKTVKLPEMKPSGYGTRATKLSGSKSRHVTIDRPKPIIQEGELSKEKMKYTAVPRQDSAGSMDKIMSHGYKEDWESNRDDWRRKQTKMQERFDAQNPPSRDNYQSEYQGMHGNQGHQGKHRPAGSGAHGMYKKRDAAGSVSDTPTQSEKELFKLSKFKNVPSKTDSHRAKQMHGPSPIVNDIEPHTVAVQ